LHLPVLIVDAIMKKLWQMEWPKRAKHQAWMEMVMEIVRPKIQRIATNGQRTKIRKAKFVAKKHQQKPKIKGTKLFFKWTRKIENDGTNLLLRKEIVKLSNHPNLKTHHSQIKIDRPIHDQTRQTPKKDKIEKTTNLTVSNLIRHQTQI